MMAVSVPRVLPWATILVSFLCLYLVGFVEAVGKGCIGLWQASDDLIFVSDSDFVGIHIVSLSRGETVERFPLAEAPVIGFFPTSVNNAISLASCQKCDYLLYTQNHGSTYRISFTDTVRNIVARQGSFVEGSVVERVRFLPAKRGDFFTVEDARGVLISSSGKRGWFVDGKSDFPGVFKVRIKGPGSPLLTRRILPLRPARGFGVSFVAGTRERQLWVPTRKGETMFRIHSKSGKIFQRLTLREPQVACPKVNSTFSKNFRQMYDDPLRPSTILALASTSDPWDAAIWSLNYETNECKFLVSESSRATGWVDGYREKVHFSRSHFMWLLEGAAHDANPKIVISDIDNRSLRVVDVNTTFTYTIMYDRDRRLQQLMKWVQKFHSATEQDENATIPVNLMTNVTTNDNVTATSLGLVSVERNCSAVAKMLVADNLMSPSNNSSARLAPSVAVLDNVSPVTVIRPREEIWNTVTYDAAKEYCEAQGFRLCEPAELKRASAAATEAARDDILADLISWTKGECASCWKRTSDTECGLPPLPNFRTFEYDHGDNKGTTFFHTWNNGTAYEIGTARLPDGAATGDWGARSITVCPGTRNQDTGEPLEALAAAVCCVDCEM